MSTDGVPTGRVAHLLDATLNLYQRATVHRLPRCRYIPTCSQYAREAIATHGATAGTLLALRRLGRCHPLGGHGFDPVPEARPRAPRRPTAPESRSVLNPIYKALGYLLAVAYSTVPPHNLGIAIILATCVVMLILFPLTAKQARSMIAMQKVQPEIKRLQAKYKNDKQKQNEEILKFYQENKINPLAGCLPLVMQIPIFIALFHVLRSVHTNVPKTGQFNKLFVDICGRAAVTSGKCQVHPKGLRFLGMDLSKSLWQVRALSIATVIPYLISILLIIATGWYQTRQTMARQQNTGTSNAMNSQMQFMTKVFPVVFGVLSLRFASGLIVYWVTSNLWRIGQQHLVLNKIYDDAQAKPMPKASLVEDDDDPDEEPPSDGSPKGRGGDGASKPAVRRPGAPKRDPNRAANGGNGARGTAGKPAGNGGKTGGNGVGKGTGNGAATPLSAGARRKKRKR